MIDYQVENEGEAVTSVKRFLAENLISHRLYADIKERGQVLVNGQPAYEGQPVLTKDTVTVFIPNDEADDTIAVSDLPLDVLYEDDSWLVVNKPAGLSSVPGPSNRDDTLVNRVKGHWQAQNDQAKVPHVITRLDRFTSGVVLIAKHKFATSLATQFQAEKQLHKSYLAIVAGSVDADHGMIDRPLRRAEEGFAQVVAEDGKDAQTEYWVIDRQPAASLLKVELHTGRTHQIRAHFASIKHPLLGDELYQGPMNDGIDRQALHAQTLNFHDPFTDQDLAFEAPLPEDFQQVMTTLKLSL